MLCNGTDFKCLFSLTNGTHMLQRRSTG